MRPESKKGWHRTKPDNVAILEAVRVVVHQYDPYGLLAMGCPDDEFDREITAIARQTHRIGSPHDAAHLVSRVLSAYFDRRTFPVEACQAVGEQLYQVLAERRLLFK